MTDEEVERPDLLAALLRSMDRVGPQLRDALESEA